MNKQKNPTTNFSLFWNSLLPNTFLGLCYGYYGAPMPWGRGFCSGCYHPCGHDFFRSGGPWKPCSGHRSLQQGCPRFRHNPCPLLSFQLPGSVVSKQGLGSPCTWDMQTLFISYPSLIIETPLSSLGEILPLSSFYKKLCLCSQILFP